MMELYRLRVRVKIAIFAACVFAAAMFVNTVSGTTQTVGCSNGKLSAKLTGWMIDSKMPHGMAEYAVSDKTTLKVSVDSVNHPDGTILAVFDGDDRLGNLPELKDGVSEITITTSKPLSEGARIRVMKEDMPILSGNLACSKED
jgi:hypothetical protein